MGNAKWRVRVCKEVCKKLSDQSWIFNEDEKCLLICQRTSRALANKGARNVFNTMLNKDHCILPPSPWWFNCLWWLPSAGTTYTESRRTLLCLVFAWVCTSDMVAKIRHSVKRKYFTFYRHEGTNGERYSFYSEVSFTPRPCLPLEWIPGTDLTWDWMGLRAGLEHRDKIWSCPTTRNAGAGGERSYSC
jgi:hypothetical protein